MKIIADFSPSSYTKTCKYIDKGCSWVRDTDCCHVHLCAANDPWPCWMPPGPGQPHLSTWCGWQSVYPAGPVRPYFQPLTRTDEKPGRLLAFSGQAGWHIVQPTATHKYTPMCTLILYTNGKHAGTQLLVHARKYCTHRWEYTHAHKHTYMHSCHHSMSQLALSGFTNTMTPAIWPVTYCSSLGLKA